MKTISRFLFATLTGVLLSGCANQAQSTLEPSALAQTIEPSDQSTLTAAAAPAAIIRSEEVPSGVQTSWGLTVPRCFKVNQFATGLNGPRRIIFAPGGTPRDYTVLAAEINARRIVSLRDSDGDGKSDSSSIFAAGLNRPYGMAFHPSGWFYVANTDRVIRYPYRPGQLRATGTPRSVSTLIADGYNNHWTRNLLFSRDNRKLYVTVGSSCNTCEEESPLRAAILEMNPDGSARRVFASGLRNPVGVAWRPGTDELWTVVNERDNLGDNVPPDYLTYVRDGGFYGWPYAYTDINRRIFPDPTFGAENPAKVRATLAPTVPVQAHSAALGVAFYPTSNTGSGVRPFPIQYAGAAFLAFHGSWNRSAKTGYKIVRVDFERNRARSVSDFVRGFLKAGAAWGRPVDVQIAPDGSLFFTDDSQGIIWRVSWGG